MAGFANSILAGSGALVRTAIKSPNYVAGSTGWTIKKDGSAEFNNGTFRGTVTASTFQGTDFVINASGAFFYSGTPALGNLIASIAHAAGSDSFGNAYPKGFGIFSGGQLKVVGTGTNYIQLDDNGRDPTTGAAIPEIQLNPHAGSANPARVWTSAKILVSTEEFIDSQPLLALQSPYDAGDVNGAISQLLLYGKETGLGSIIQGSADSYQFITTNDFINFTANGAVNVDPGNTGTATHAFIAGTIGSGSVNWYRFSGNTWGTDDDVHLPDGKGVLVGSGYDLGAAFAAGRTNLTDDVFSARISTDTNSRFVVTANGIIHLGAGGATAVDTALQRDAAGVIGVTSAVVGHGETWHAPTYNSTWTGSTVFNSSLTALQTLQYRQDAEDNLWLVGCFKCGAGPSANPIFTLPVGWRPATSQLVFCMEGPAAGGNTLAGTLFVSSGGNVSMFGGDKNVVPTANDTYYVNGKVPLGNIS